MNADIQAYQLAKQSVTQDDFEQRLAHLENDLLDAKCRKTASLIREARRALSWEFAATTPPSISEARIDHG